MENKMTKEFDPGEGLSQEDLQYINTQKDAFERQSAAHGMHSTDAGRKDAADAHRREVMKQGGVEVPATLPGAPTAPVPTHAGVPTMFSVLRAAPDTGDGGATLAPAGEQYAPDWALMKERIAKHDGTWIVEHYEFHPQVAFILGFFGKEGWEAPKDSKKKSFEVIVKNGRVFRTDPE
jgi:hypothetical protein